MSDSTQAHCTEQARGTKLLLEEVWQAIDGTECETCDGNGYVGAEDAGEICNDCDGTDFVYTYEGQDAREYLEELPLEVVWEVGEEFAVVLGTGGPHVEITGGGRNGAYNLHVYWAGDHAQESGSAITRTGEYFRELYDKG